MTRWIVGVLIGTALSHVAAVTLAPYAIMHAAMGRLKAAATNAFAHVPLATAASRTIVRPSPDLAYSTLVFDVSERALEVSVPLTAPYTSLSGFASNTDNFFAINDRTALGSEIAIVLVGPSTPRADFANARVVESPSDRGILLVRRVVARPAAFAELDAVRRRATAKPR